MSIKLVDSLTASYYLIVLAPLLAYSLYAYYFLLFSLWTPDTSRYLVLPYVASH
jgi:hypothetical protein